jgi:hypothetical protein
MINKPTSVTMNILLQTVFSIWSDQRLYNENKHFLEEGYNTSTVALQVVRGDERELSAQGYNWATLFIGDINMGTWTSRLRESKKLRQ